VGFPVKVGDSLQELRDAPKDSVDCIIAFNFYEHLTRELMLEFFSISARVLKPGGCLILLGPNGDTPVVGRALFNDITHQWALTSYSFTQVLKMAGFGSVQFKDGTTASIRRGRLVKVPLIRAAQAFLRILFRLATLERIEYFSSSFYICARKAQAPSE
jgi:SAM-dependent methyltransferase